MALSKKSLEQAKQVLQQIMHSNVDVIVTRATLDKKIELVKFPYLYDMHMKRPQNRTLYVSNQYDPIRYWLINNKFLTSSKNASGVYQYKVNREAISLFFANNSIAQSNNTKNETKKVMTKREKVFRHIEDSGNAMRYTDIIKFAYELSNGIGSFDKKANRGYYACAFTYYSYWSAIFGGQRKKNIGSPKGHFVTPTKNGYLKKLPNGLWTVVRPDNFIRSKNDSVPVSDNTLGREFTVIPQDEYMSMCDVLKKYNVTSDQLDNLATDYLHKKDGDAVSCYHWAYYDLLEKAGAISDTTKELQKEIDNIIDQSIPKQKIKQYIVLNKEVDEYEGYFTADEVHDFFDCDRDPKNYIVIEAGDIVTIEKKTTTTITIKK